MKIIIAGGRTFENYKLLKYKMNRIIETVSTPITIISGGAQGADTLGERYAKEYGYFVKRYEADWDNVKAEGAVIKKRESAKRGESSYYNAVAGHQRNQKMANEADALVAFWNGSSTGTADMIKRAKLKGLKVRIIKYA